MDIPKECKFCSHKKADPTGRTEFCVTCTRNPRYTDQFRPHSAAVELAKLFEAPMRTKEMDNGQKEHI